MAAYRSGKMTLMIAWALALFFAAGPAAAQGKKPNDQLQINPVSCGQKQVFFAGQCRGSRYVSQFVAKNWTLVGFSGCSHRPVKPGLKTECGQSITITEEKSPGDLRVITLSADSPAQFIMRLGRNSAGQAVKKTGARKFIARNNKLVLARIRTTSTPLASGIVALKERNYVLGPDGILHLTVSQDLILNPHSAIDINQDFDVGGRICLPAELPALQDGEPDCTCLSENYCGRRANPGTGAKFTKTPVGYRYCSISHGPSPALNGIVISELDLGLKRFVGAANVAGSNGKQKGKAETCFSVNGYANAAVLQAYQSNEGSSSSSTCGPKISAAADMTAYMCQIGSAATAVVGGGLWSLAEVEMTGFVVGTSSGVSGLGIDGKPLSIANVLVEAADNMTQVYNNLPTYCANNQMGIAAASIAQNLCGQFDSESCAGTREAVPVTVSTDDNRVCDATADLTCSSAGSDSIKFGDAGCQCSMDNLVVNEQSCR